MKRATALLLMCLSYPYSPLIYAAQDAQTNITSASNKTVIQKSDWWKNAVIYQAYIRSFKDSNGDGVGDIKGLIQKLDYLQSLGVNGLWISPHYDSPNVDNGYDVRDYKKINKELGTMHDFNILVAELKKRNMFLTIDVVVNHTSDQNIWFKKSRLSRNSPYRNFYFWHDPVNNKEPNNYQSIFSGSAWELDKKTDQYYLHYFSKNQPDLNWDNPNVRSEIYSMLEFWLNKGVSGLRFDSIVTISKIPGFPDLTPEEMKNYAGAYTHGPKVHEYIHDMYTNVFSKYDVVTFGEMMAASPEDIPLYYDPARQELNASMHMGLVYFDRNDSVFWQSYPFQLTKYRAEISTMYRSVGANGWNTFFLSNHDVPHALSHLGDDNSQYSTDSAKALATLLLTQQATPIIYQGDEIGMTNFPFSDISQFREISAIKLWNNMVLTGKYTKDEYMYYARKVARDNARTPFQWDTSKNAGFSTGTPWIAVNPNYINVNVQNNLSDPNSIYHYYQQLIRVRRAIPALVTGKFTDLNPSSDQIYAYTRTLGRITYLIVINFTENTLTYKLPGKSAILHQVIQSKGAKAHFMDREIQLQPWQSGIYRLR